MMRKAGELAPGSLVRVRLKGVWRPALLARRQGKDYETRHLALLDPPGELLPVDPDTPLKPLAARLRLDPAPPGESIPVGGAFQVAEGRWLKVEEDYKGQRSLACVNLDDGAVVRRRDRRPEVSPLTLTLVRRRWPWG